MFPVFFGSRGPVPCVTAEEGSFAVLPHGLGRSLPTEGVSVLPPRIFVLPAGSKSLSLPLALSSWLLFLTFLAKIFYNLAIEMGCSWLNKIE